MTEHNLLYIAYYFPPMGLSGVQRTVKFAKYLPDYGWKPHILTYTPNSFYAFDETLNEDFNGREIEIFRTFPKKLKVQKTTKLPSYAIQKVGRALLQVVYQPDSKIKWKKPALELASEIIRDNKIDAIMATAPPFTDFLIARELSKKHDIPFIVDYRDMWVDNPFHFYATPFHKNLAIKMEEEILKHANQIIVITRQAKETLLRRYKFISHNDITIIPHGYDPEDFATFTNTRPDPAKFTITHSGVFQDDRSPKFFLKALSQFISKNKDAGDRIEARFIGVMRKGHQKMIKKYGLINNVVTTGYVSHKDAVRHLMESDVLWMMLNDTVRTPGKLYEYFGAGKPMLICSPDGTIRKTAMDSKAAICVDPQDVTSIEASIQSLYSLWKNKTLPVPSEEFTSQFDRRKLTGELARELALSLEVV